MVVIHAVCMISMDGELLLSFPLENECSEELQSHIHEITKMIYDGNDIMPIIHLHNYYHTIFRYKSIYFTSIVSSSEGIVLSFSFLSNLKDLLFSKLNELTSESIKDNILYILELMHELIYDGFPQICDSNYESHVFDKHEATIIEHRNGYRNPYLFNYEVFKFRKNEIFIDFIENVQYSINEYGEVLSCNIKGECTVKPLLSGLLTITLNLNDRLMALLSRNQVDLSMHQNVVSLTLDDSSTKIIFSPTDIQFSLLNYTISIPSIKPNIIIEPITLYFDEYQEHMYKIYTKDFKASDICISIPVCKDLHFPDVLVKSSISTKVQYTPENNCIVWKIGELYQNDIKTLSLKIKNGYPNVDKLKPLEIEYILYYKLVSSIRINSLSISEKYKPGIYPRFCSKCKISQIQKII